MLIDYDALEAERHPACVGGCGELADECACAAIRAARANAPRDHDGFCTLASDHDGWCYDTTPEYVGTCRWNGCDDDAETRGYCDPHWGTL